MTRTSTISGDGESREHEMVSDEMEKLETYIKSIGPTVSIPQNISAAELSNVSGVSEARIVELAEAQFIPHIIIDGGKIRFVKKFAVQWIRNNLIHTVNGHDLPLTFNVYQSGDTAEYNAIPSAIQHMHGLLRRMEGFLRYPPCVYFLVNNMTVVYVGQTINLMSRIGSHLETKTFDDVLYINCPKSKLSMVEIFYIKYLSPKYNKTSCPKDNISIDEALASVDEDVQHLCLKESANDCRGE